MSKTVLILTAVLIVLNVYSPAYADVAPDPVVRTISYLPVILVVAVVALAAYLIFFYFKKKK